MLVSLYQFITCFLSHLDVAPFRWGNQGTERGSSCQGHTAQMGFPVFPHPARGQEATWNRWDNEVTDTSFLSRSSLEVTQRAGWGMSALQDPSQQLLFLPWVTTGCVGWIRHPYPSSILLLLYQLSTFKHLPSLKGSRP